MAQYGPVKKGNGNGGPQWTPEEKAAFEKQQDAAFRAFRYLMRQRAEGETRDFIGVVIDVTEPYDKDVTFQGVTTRKTVRTIKVELQGNKPVRLPDTGEVVSVDGIRFIADTADNPLNDKTMLYKLYRAVTGITPDPDEGLEYEWDNSYGIPINCTIRKEGERKPENGRIIRGGFFSSLKGFSRIYRDEDEEVVAPTPTTPTKTGPTKTAKQSSGGATPATPVDDDEKPW